jgi:Domain of unknown function (DUF4124)
MNRLPALSALVLAAGLAFVPAVHAQWKWKDPGGVVQYSDRPPPQGTAEKDILQRPNPRNLPAAGAPAPAASAPAAAPEAKPGNPAEDRRRQAEKDDAARKAAADEERSAKVRADNCQRARGQLRGLEDGARMSRVNEKGEREFLDDAGRAEETRRMREIVASDCAR